RDRGGGAHVDALVGGALTDGAHPARREERREARTARIARPSSSAEPARGAQRSGGGLPAARSAAVLAPSGTGSESAEVSGLVARGRPVCCAGRHGREVALTFDDGPGPYTRLVLRKLRKHHLSATFFVVARNSA